LDDIGKELGSDGHSIVRHYGNSRTGLIAAVFEPLLTDLRQVADTPGPAHHIVEAFARLLIAHPEEAAILVGDAIALARTEVGAAIFAERAVIRRRISRETDEMTAGVVLAAIEAAAVNAGDRTHPENLPRELRPLLARLTQLLGPDRTLG
jgi:hypothetical protein